ncbi:MAG: hypothetical protein Q4P20_11550 [Eubacteriales bacterium]|nr:hypothetical protein [Eubacteriales bacterium]
MANEVVGCELDWEEEIENDGNDFVLLNEGEYDFVVTKFERGRSKGSDKLPPCNMAILTIRVDDQTTIIENLILHSKMEWKLCQFFTSIGLRKHGEKMRMNWGKVLGATGRCKIIVEDFTGRDGKERQTNRIDKFLEPEGQATVTNQTQQRKWTPGNF